MIATKSKYTKNSTQLWIFKVALLFSVFAFSGFNLQAEQACLESIQTELVEAKHYNSVALSLNNYTKNNSTITSKIFLFDFKSDSYIYFLMSFDRLIIVQYQLLYKQFLSYNFTFIKLPIKTFSSSSQSDIPPFSI